MHQSLALIGFSVPKRRKKANVLYIGRPILIQMWQLHKFGGRLNYTIVPKHFFYLIAQGILANSTNMKRYNYKIDHQKMAYRAVYWLKSIFTGFNKIRLRTHSQLCLCMAAESLSFAELAQFLSYTKRAWQVRMRTTICYRNIQMDNSLVTQCFCIFQIKSAMLSANVHGLTKQIWSPLVYQDLTNIWDERNDDGITFSFYIEDKIQLPLA